MIDITPVAFRKLEFTVPGEPNQKRSPQPRAMKVTRNDGTVFYKGIATKHAKNSGVESNIQDWCFKAGWEPGSKPYDGPVRLRVVSYFKCLASVKKWEVPYYETERILHTRKPDIDRLCNMVQDALTGVVWADDSQVCMCGQSAKFYSYRPRMEVTIWLIKKQMPESQAEYKNMIKGRD